LRSTGDANVAHVELRAVPADGASPRSRWFESARLWPAIIGGPGAGKTPGTNTALAPVFAVHRELIAEWTKTHADDDEDDLVSLCRRLADLG